MRVTLNMLSFVSCIKYTVLYYLEPGATHLRSRSRVDSAARHRCGIREPRDLDREEAVAQAVRGYTQTLAVRRRGRGRGERGPKEGSFDRTSLRHRTCRFLIAPCHHSQMQAATRLRRWHLRSLRGTRRPHPRRRDASPSLCSNLIWVSTCKKKTSNCLKRQVLCTTAGYVT